MCYTRHNKQFIEQQFINHIGQTINPGDDVLVISERYDYGVCQGTYRGVMLNHRDKVDAVVVDNIKTRRFNYKFREYEDTIKKSVFPRMQIYKLA